MHVSVDEPGCHDATRRVERPSGVPPAGHAASRADLGYPVTKDGDGMVLEHTSRRGQVKDVATRDQQVATNLLYDRGLVTVSGGHDAVASHICLS